MQKFNFMKKAITCFYIMAFIALPVFGMDFRVKVEKFLSHNRIEPYEVRKIRKFPIDLLMKYQPSLLHEALEQKKTKSVELLLAKGWDVTKDDHGYYRSLFDAADSSYLFKEQVKLVRLLIESGIDINKQTSGGLTALWNASWSLLLILLINGADQKLKTYNPPQGLFDPPKTVLEEYSEDMAYTKKEGGIPSKRFVSLIELLTLFSSYNPAHFKHKNAAYIKNHVYKLLNNREDAARDIASQWLQKYFGEKATVDKVGCHVYPQKIMGECEATADQYNKNILSYLTKELPKLRHGIEDEEERTEFMLEDADKLSTCPSCLTGVPVLLLYLN